MTAPPDPTGVYRYCRWDRMPAYLDAGWIFEGEVPGHHALWSVLVRACECNPDGRKP